MLKKSKLLWGGVVVVLILIGLALGGVVVTRYFYWAIRWEWGSNTGEFVTEARRVPLNTAKIRVMVTDKRSNVVKTLDIQPEWETLTYRFTDAGPPRPPGNDPSTVILEFINQLRTTEKPSRVRVEDLIHPHRRNDFPWENLTPRYWRSNKISVLEDYITYEGRRLGYRDVFSATISFVKIISYGESIAIARQKIYITDYNHGWKIIDADPVAVVVEPEILAKLESKEKASGTCSVYHSPQFGYCFRIPGKWEGKYIVREQGNATSFIYIAHPTKNTSLLTFNVYTQPEWTNRLRLRQADHEIKFAVKDGLVIALAFPATNPYKNLKTDKKYAEEYLSMILTLNEVRERFSK